MADPFGGLRHSGEKALHRNLHAWPLLEHGMHCGPRLTSPPEQLRAFPVIRREQVSQQEQRAASLLAPARNLHITTSNLLPPHWHAERVAHTACVVWF